ncbi:MAG: carboxypeptidase-like regulatory domain-containing protein [Verrucomicrobiota bacterium]|nr:carboxypeptidase-like regulatory domain-containing protein [Verrucomicrobiota bacterium]
MQKISLVAICALTSALVATSGVAQSTVQGDVKGVDGRTAQHARVRLEPVKKGGKAIEVTADGRGRFVANNIADGAYNVTATVAGGVQSPTQMIQARSGHPVMMTFDLRPTGKAAATGGKKKKKFVWMPSETGSHLGGHYVEVDESAGIEPNAQNLHKANSNALRQFQDMSPNPSGGGL